MVGLKKRHIKKMLKTGAKADGASLADIRTDIEATIDEAMTSTDPEVQANFRKLFEISVPHQRNIFIRLQKRQRLNFKNLLSQRWCFYE